MWQNWGFRTQVAALRFIPWVLLAVAVVVLRTAGHRRCLIVRRAVAVLAWTLRRMWLILNLLQLVVDVGLLLASFPRTDRKSVV